MTLWSFLVTFSKGFTVRDNCLFTRCKTVWYPDKETVIAAAIAVTSIRSKNQHAGELPNSNKKLKNRFRMSIEAKYVHFVLVLNPL